MLNRVADVTNWGDPDFSWCSGGDTRCRMGFANYIQGGSNIYTYASASWAFFSGPGYQGCANDQCQSKQSKSILPPTTELLLTCKLDYMHWITQTPTNFQSFGFCSKSTYSTLRLADGTTILPANGFSGSWGGLVGRYTPN
jgi:hypothetical protein